MNSPVVAQQRRIYQLEVVAAEPGTLITYDQIKLAGAICPDDPDPARIAVETRLHKALVTIYPCDPLETVTLPTDYASLAMDKAGYILIGRYHHGRPARYRLYNPAEGSALRSCLFGTTGAGKSSALQIIVAGEKRSRVVVTWLADLKGGQSVPEAKTNVDWWVTTQEGAIAMLRTAWMVMQERQRRYSALGRSKFLLGRPDWLLSVRIDEANRLLGPSSPYREEACWLITEIGRAGRSLGIGIHLAAQASHLEELGGSDTLRAMIKEGETILLRWSSRMMQQLVSDGLVPNGQQLAPLPRYADDTQLVSQFDEDEAGEETERVGTGGTAYLLSGRYPTARMRFFKIGSDTPCEGLDPKVLALYGTDEPLALTSDDWYAAGQAYATRLDGPAAMTAIAPVPAFTPTTGGGGGGNTGGKGSGGTPARAPTLIERVQAAADPRGGPGQVSARDIYADVLADGGSEIAEASVANALSTLRKRQAAAGV